MTRLRKSSGPAAATGAQRVCDLCGGRRFERIGRLDRGGRPLETGICLECGLVAHVSLPTDADLDAYYASQYRWEYHGEWEPSAKRVMRAWKNGQRIYRLLAPRLGGSERVFEVGAGLGCTVKVFEKHGHDASGIEPGENFQRFARQRLAANVAAAGLFDFEAGPRYDLVLLVHVIEHFRSPTRALQAIHRLLKDGGLLYLECPNLAAPFAVRRRLFHFAHVHNFTPTTLCALAEKCGFQVHSWLSDPRDPNLQVLLRRVEHGRLRVDPQGYRKSMEAVTRYNVLTYHLRLRYLFPRLKKLASYLREALTAKRFVKQLCAECLKPTRASASSGKAA